MVSGIFHIKINSGEDNKDSGFYSLLLSGSSIICLENDEYIIPEEAVEKLNEKEICYEIVTKKEKGVAIKKEENNQNATKT